jgi:transcriptional pleiotropic regulator of transition state genes
MKKNNQKNIFLPLKTEVFSFYFFSKNLTNLPLVGKIIEQIVKGGRLMKKTFRVRKIDNLGRVVIPMDIRKSLEIKDWDDLRIFLEEDRIILTKAHDYCIFCGSEENLTSFHDRSVCSSCLSELKNK